MTTDWLPDAAKGRDDHALERVPQRARYPWISVAAQRFGQMSDLTTFLIGATLGFGMTFWDAFLALTFGAVIIEVVAVVIGIAGQREGLSTSILTRWTGLGQVGSALLGLAIAVSLVGWFGIQSQLSGRSLENLLGGLPEWGWSLLFGLVVTVIVVYGFRWMAW
ncbi:MAG: cytosine permease, partial [Gemmatimonadales bacterium]